MDDLFFKAQDFRALLLTELSVRQNRNPNYSVRAFARDLGLQQQRLNQILNKRLGLSLLGAKKIAKKLHWPELKTDFFCNLVISQCARSKAQRRYAQNKLLSFSNLDQFRHLKDHEISQFDSWRFPVILELVEKYKTKATLQLISEALDCSLEDLTKDIDHLLRMNILRKRGSSYFRDKNYEKVWTERPTPTKNIRAFHRQILDQASRAIEKQSISERKFQSAIFTMKKEKIEEAREKIQKFHEEFLREFYDKEGDQIYAASFQLFKAAKNV